MSLYHGIKATYPDIQEDDFELWDEGQGPYIKQWHYTKAPQPTNLAELITLGEQEQQKQSYRLKRQAAYPPISEQLDMLWHALDQGKLDKSCDFYTQLKAVKDKYPKPT